MAVLEARAIGVQASVDAAVNAVTLPKTATRTVRMGKFGFCFRGLDLDRVHRWCLAHNFSLSHLVRCAIRARALEQGVDLPVYASGVSKGFKDASPQKYSGICVPEAWASVPKKAVP